MPDIAVGGLPFWGPRLEVSGLERFPTVSFTLHGQGAPVPQYDRLVDVYLPNGVSGLRVQGLNFPPLRGQQSNVCEDSSTAGVDHFSVPFWVS